MEKKPKQKYLKLKVIFYFLVSLFSCLYFASQTGYYEKNISKQTLLTKEALICFEKDIQEGKNVDIKDYLPKVKEDYQNKASSLGNFLSNSIDTFLNDGVSYIFKFLKTLFT